MVGRFLSRFHPRRGEASRLVTTIAGVGALAAAGAYYVYAYAVVFVYRIGPTTVSLSEANGWGVHTGDALALPLVLMGLVSGALAVVCLAPHRPVALVVRPLARR